MLIRSEGGKGQVWSEKGGGKREKKVKGSQGGRNVERLEGMTGKGKISEWF